MVHWLLTAVLTIGVTSSVVTGCGDALNSRGTFMSPNHPRAYPSSTACTWTLTADPGNTLTLQFTAFDVEYDTRCSYDSVKVYNGPVSAPTLVGRFCGSTIPAMISGFEVLTVVFTSDIATEMSGFSAKFESVQRPGGSLTTAARVPTVTQGATVATTSNPGKGGSSCGDYTGSTGTLTSPNYPNKYPSAANCIYTITVPNSKIVLTFPRMDIESSPNCLYDYLEVRDDDATGKVLARVCGNTVAGSITSTGNRLYLKFVSDSTIELTGFQASWQELTCETKGGACVSSGECDGRTDSSLPCDRAGAVCCVPRIQQGACGTVPRSRIVGGNESVPHAWPWQASLQMVADSFHYCGATVITPEWIVTAAHCVDGSPTISMKVVVGEHHLEQPNQEQVYSIQKYIMHEDYDQNGNGFPNDIAIVKLTAPIIFNRYVQPACLPELDEEFVPGDECVMTGWGDTKGTGNSKVLNQLQVDVLTRPYCRTLWGDSYIREGHICLGNGLKGSCNGDSGGPLSCRRKRNGIDRWILAGTTSWGQIGCQTEGKPSVYVRVSHYLPWIERKIAENTYN